MYDQNDTNVSDANRAVCQTHVNVYNCPSDTEVQTLGQPASGPARYAYAFSSYRAMCGRSNGHIGVVPQGGWWDGYEYQDIANKGWRGVLHVVGPGTSATYGGGALDCERFSTVKDGTSTTLAVGELHRPIKGSQEIPTRGTFWAYSYTSYNASDACPYSSTLLANDWARCRDGVPGRNDNFCKRGWGSYHAGIVNFAMVDGAVNSIPVTIDINLFCAMASIMGGEPAYIPGR